MNDYYAPVTLPPVEQWFTDYTEIISRRLPPYYVLDPSVLSDQGVNFFKSMDVSPKFIVIFISKPDASSVSLAQRTVHRDITLDDNNQWQSMRCALNWEVTPSTLTEWHWFDMSSVAEVWPNSIPNDPAFCRLSGIHYGARYQTGITPEARMLAKTCITGPALFRVDVPHGVTYHSPNTDSRRVCISMRFDESNWNSWEKCLHAFRSIIATPPEHNQSMGEVL